MPDYETRLMNLIAAIAAFYELPLPLARAVPWLESGYDPNNVGDNGHSVGLCQLHDEGQGAGLCCSSQDWRYAEPVNLAVSFWYLHNTPHDGMTLGQWAAASQRPADPISYAAAIDDYCGKFRE